MAASTKQQRTRGADYPEPAGVPRSRRGRPSRFFEERTEHTRLLAAAGHTACEIAAEFGVSERTLYSWGIEHPDLLQALKAGREAATDRVERRLYQKAVIDGDNTAMIFYLKNRRPQEWNDRRDINLTGAIETTGATDIRHLALAVIALLREAGDEEMATIEHQEAAE